jgi:hypothetical protein
MGALDGTGNTPNSGNPSSVNTALTTTAAGKIFCAITTNNANCDIVSVTASGLTFTEIAQTGVRADFAHFALWVSDSAGAFSGNITANTFGGNTTSYWVQHVWGWSDLGARDVNGASLDSDVGDVNLSVSSTAAATVLFVAHRSGTGTPSVPGGYTTIEGGANHFTATYYQVFASAQTGLAVNPDDHTGAIAVFYQASAGGGGTAVKDIIGSGFIPHAR